MLLNTDKTHRAASIYRLGLAIILDCLPGASVMAALALEDIAYAYYVLEYSSGDFVYAIECADVAGTILKRLQYEVCMQAASANRVKALILEEIALDDNDPSRTKSYLYTARDLHLQSLDLCERTFGTWNIQTAKHFGNLGRLFQSMEHNKAAEEMHLKAIMIKERLLGANDFEVGLSVGHLASLYNYHMNRYHEAELLYLRSIKISLNLFGPTYSGLEYDYRGLQRVYRKLGETAKLQHYQSLFDEWHMQRQSLGFLEPTDSEPIEPSFRSGTLEEGQRVAAEDEENEEEEENALTQLLEDYRVEFSSVFGQSAGVSGSSKVESTSDSSQASPGRSISPAPGGENSRSTGY
ncbi:unnamed protein product [Schistocephalus solidus]|uniref:Amyloid protein-binding protein 2 n=1 Tax=Schistocephalus solidus TaxID=70667 RepID=A0A3P7DD29_SCHSO|nr:unnamed protein product [Schistocephalus solidus]